MFWKEPMIATFVSAMTIRVRVAFSTVNFVFPLWQAAAGTSAS
jgi:hypothetical protein